MVTGECCSRLIDKTFESRVKKGDICIFSRSAQRLLEVIICFKINNRDSWKQIKVRTMSTLFCNRSFDIYVKTHFKLFTQLIDDD